MSSRALVDTSGLHQSCVQNSPLGPRQPVRMLVKSMLGNSHRSPHRYNQVCWKLKAIRNRTGFIFISNNMHCNGDHADGKLNHISASFEALILIYVHVHPFALLPPCCPLRRASSPQDKTPAKEVRGRSLPERR